MIRIACMSLMRRMGGAERDTSLTSDRSSGSPHEDGALGVRANEIQRQSSAALDDSYRWSSGRTSTGVAYPAPGRMFHPPRSTEACLLQPRAMRRLAPRHLQCAETGRSACSPCASTSTRGHGSRRCSDELRAPRPDALWLLYPHASSGEPPASGYTRGSSIAVTRLAGIEVEMVRSIEPHVARVVVVSVRRRSGARSSRLGDGSRERSLRRPRPGLGLRVCGLLLSAGAEVNVGATVAASDEDQGEHQA
jgi:hypothetical protein